MKNFEASATVITRRKGKVIGRINKTVEKSDITDKESKGKKLDSSAELERVKQNLQEEMAGWQANRGSGDTSREEAERRWKNMTKK